MAINLKWRFLQINVTFSNKSNKSNIAQPVVKLDFKHLIVILFKRYSLGLAAGSSPKHYQENIHCDKIGVQILIWTLYCIIQYQCQSISNSIAANSSSLQRRSRTLWTLGILAHAVLEFCCATCAWADFTGTVTIVMRTCPFYKSRAIAAKIVFWLVTVLHQQFL